MKSILAILVNDLSRNTSKSRTLYQWKSHLKLARDSHHAEEKLYLINYIWPLIDKQGIYENF